MYSMFARNINYITIWTIYKCNKLPQRNSVQLLQLHNYLEQLLFQE